MNDLSDTLCSPLINVSCKLTGDNWKKIDSLFIDKFGTGKKRLLSLQSSTYFEEEKTVYTQLTDLKINLDDIKDGMAKLFGVKKLKSIDDFLAQIPLLGLIYDKKDRVLIQDKEHCLVKISKEKGHYDLSFKTAWRLSSDCQNKRLASDCEFDYFWQREIPGTKFAVFEANPLYLHLCCDPTGDPDLTRSFLNFYGESSESSSDSDKQATEEESERLIVLRSKSRMPDKFDESKVDKSKLLLPLLQSFPSDYFKPKPGYCLFFTSPKKYKIICAYLHRKELTFLVRNDEYEYLAVWRDSMFYNIEAEDFHQTLEPCPFNKQCQDLFKNVLTVLNKSLGVLYFEEQCKSAQSFGSFITFEEVRGHKVWDFKKGQIIQAGDQYFELDKKTCKVHPLKPTEQLENKLRNWSNTCLVENPSFSAEASTPSSSLKPHHSLAVPTSNKATTSKQENKATTSKRATSSAEDFLKGPSFSSSAGASTPSSYSKRPHTSYSIEDFFNGRSSSSSAQASTFTESSMNDFFRGPSSTSSSEDFLRGTSFSSSAEASTPSPYSSKSHHSLAVPTSKQENKATTSKQENKVTTSKQENKATTSKRRKKATTDSADDDDEDEDDEDEDSSNSKRSFLPITFLVFGFVAVSSLSAVAYFSFNKSKNNPRRATKIRRKTLPSAGNFRNF
eukprot:GHVP01043609.1.p1 GENE.GHVP01043609.1~~GHVP01043609.1.p1  ORF type:complete len:722 (+),score=135.11 GHVP01043609.1:150-2168(+)